MTVTDTEVWEWLWEHCHITLYPNNGFYPLEHNPAANKNMRQPIEHYARIMVEQASRSCYFCHKPCTSEVTITDTTGAVGVAHKACYLASKRELPVMA